MECWHLPFCRRHGDEAEAAALAELWEDARRGALAALEGGRESWRRNAALLLTLRRAYDEARDLEEAHNAAHEDALAAAYGDADASRTDPDTLRYNGDDFAGDSVSWWRETRVAVCKAMREAVEGRLTHAGHLEPLREYASVQEVLALRLELSGAPA